MANTESTKYFQLDGGDTVIVKEPSGWVRWDKWDGVLSTNVAWAEDSPRLREVSREEAFELLKK